MTTTEKTKSESQEEVLLREFEAMASFVNTFFVMRASVLGVGITAIGAIIQFSRNTPENLGLFFDACVIVMPFVIHKLIGASIRTSYVFAERMATISKGFGVTSYWDIWPYYVVNRPWDGGIWIFVIAQRFVYGGAFVYLWMRELPAIVGAYPTWLPRVPTAFSFGLLVAGSVFLTVGFFSIRADMDPGHFGSKIKCCWQQACKNAGVEG